jgi:putative transposase
VTPDFCLDAVQETVHRAGTPAIFFNTDQGCPFTSLECTGRLKNHGSQISRDGQGCWRDNVFVARRWKRVTYEEGYLYASECVSAVRNG